MLGFISFTASQCSSISGSDPATAATQISNVQYPKEVIPKQKGAHIFGRIDSTNLLPFLENNIEWITLVPYASQKNYDTPNVRYFRGDSLQQLRRDSMWKSQIDLAHSAGFKVFLKPHIWLTTYTDGKWRSDIYPANEADWEIWQKEYRDFILHYANIAQKNEVELFCIGAELTRLTIEQPAYWTKLLEEVRSIYSGKVTYAANWYKEYEAIKFWNELDYIGIQAYFPLVKQEHPTAQQISKGWDKYLPKIEAVSKQYNRNVLFTEMGYKSTADSAIEPWVWVEDPSNNSKTLSFETQANCYKAFFNKVWEKEWFAGVHIWQMRNDFEKGRGMSDFDFTPQGKPAETILKNGFNKKK